MSVGPFSSASTDKCGGMLMLLFLRSANSSWTTNAALDVLFRADVFLGEGDLFSF